MAMFSKNPAFQQSYPILVTSFINKAGAIGLALMPILLVEKHIQAAEGALIMTTLQVVLIIGTFLSGVLNDHFGVKKTLMIAFLLAGFGYLTLPLAVGVFSIIVLGSIAQLGAIVTNQSTRMLLIEVVEVKHHQEALGWSRAAGNIAQIISFGLGTVTSFLGLTPLFLLDGLTSIAAFLYCYKKVPESKVEKLNPIDREKPKPKPTATWFAFVMATIGVGFWSLTYEMFMAGIAGKLKLVNPDSGLRIFSILMLLNVVICAFLAVPAAKYIKNSIKMMVLAIALTFLGLVLASQFTDQLMYVYLGAFLATAGEIVYGATGQYTLLKSTPRGLKPGTAYSIAMTTMSGFRLVGAALAFPLIVYGKSNHSWIVGMIGTGLITAFVAILIQKRFPSHLEELTQNKNTLD